MTRTGLDAEVVLKSRSASSPGCRGIAKSSRRISGLSCRASFTASAPSQASPMTFRSGSASSRRRNPSRKMGWSSAITMRIGWLLLLSILRLPVVRDRDFQPRTPARIRFYREFSFNQTHPFPNDQRPLAHRFQFDLGEASCEGESLTVILNGQLPAFFVGCEPDQNPFRLAMLADVDQALLHNTD